MTGSEKPEPACRPQHDTRQTPAVSGPQVQYRCDNQTCPGRGAAESRFRRRPAASQKPGFRPAAAKGREQPEEQARGREGRASETLPIVDIDYKHPI